MVRRAATSVRQYREALVAIEARLNDDDRRALAAHAAAPDHDLSDEDLGEAAGAGTPKWTHGQYGRVGRELAEALGLDQEDLTGIWTRSIGKDRREGAEEGGRVRWKMHRNLAAAIKKMPWGRDPNAARAWGIEREHVLAAIRDLDAGTKHPFHESTKYDLVYEGRRYAPKAVFGFAARHAAGAEIGPEDFTAGTDSTCFRTLERAGFEIVPKDGTGSEPEGPRHWWVNHKQTVQQEREGGYLWSPKKNSNGARNRTYDNMTDVRPGDAVFSFANAQIGAVGIATGTARSAPKPTEFGKAGDSWSDDGWYVPVEFKELEKPLRPQAVAEQLAPLLPKRHSPIRANGMGNQGVYLGAVPDAMAAKLRELLAGQVEKIEESIDDSVIGEGEEAAEEADLKQRTDIGPVEKQQLVKARRGQGVYRSNLNKIEKACRVTGIADRRHLRASHIKPWVKSDDQEKLDGYNGLLLAPHVDHLFDQGYISFTDEGAMLVSDQLDRKVLERWGIDPGRNYGPFKAQQRAYLAYHRDHRFARK
jgi:hypothetical protein